MQWLITQRVLQAQRLLETSDYSVDEVAGRCGFRSPVALRGHFRRQLGSSPASYRAAYRARRPQEEQERQLPPQELPALRRGPVSQILAAPGKGEPDAYSPRVPEQSGRTDLPEVPPRNRLRAGRGLGAALPGPRDRP